MAVFLGKLSFIAKLHAFAYKKSFFLTCEIMLTLSLVGFLKTRIWWGGANLTPPPLNFLQICKNRIFYRKIQLYSKNVCKKKICPKNEKLYIFEKPLTMPFQIYKYFCKILNNLIFNQEKLKMCKFPLTGCLQKILHFFRNFFVQFVSLCQRLSKKLNFIKI